MESTVNLISQVRLSDGTVYYIPNRETEWQLRYGDVEKMRFIAASIISSFDYLLSNNITTKQAMQKLSQIRKIKGL